MRWGRSVGLVAAGLLIGAVVATGAAVAQDSAPEISSCVNTRTGAVRIVTADTTCRTTEYPLSWSQQGPQGPQGPAGSGGDPVHEFVGAATYQLVTDGCPEGQYRGVVHQVWGSELAWTDTDCATPQSASGNFFNLNSYGGSATFGPGIPANDLVPGYRPNSLLAPDEPNVACGVIFKMPSIDVVEIGCGGMWPSTGPLPAGAITDPVSLYRVAS